VKGPDEIDIHVGELIRTHRLAAGMSQRELAEGAGVTFQQMQKYEKGANRVGAGRLTKIANKLGVDASNFLPKEQNAKAGNHELLRLFRNRGAVELLRTYDSTDAEGRRLMMQNAELVRRKS
jgi:transcriptional regulator with XRE-family HTH domain